MTCESACRSLHWERGLKHHRHAVRPVTFMSLPSLGAWIETDQHRNQCRQRQRRSLHWERGLKHGRVRLFNRRCMSLPSLGAWIETSRWIIFKRCPSSRSLHWERGLKHSFRQFQDLRQGRSLHWERGLKLWDAAQGWSACQVAPFTGSVD